MFIFIDKIVLLHILRIYEKKKNEPTHEILVQVLIVYLHFRRNPLMNLQIFAIVYNVMNYTTLIDNYQAHLTVQ